MNSSESIFRRIVLAVATVGVIMLSGASGAQATPGLAAGLAASHEPGHDDSSEEEDNSEEDENSDEDEDSEDEDDSSDEENSDEDNESDEPTDEPTEQPTFTDPPTTDTGITEMPTNETDATSEDEASPLGWILLAGGVACAGAAIAVYRRNRHMM